MRVLRAVKKQSWVSWFFFVDPRRSVGEMPGKKPFGFD
jgi:hypothetical protein